MKTVIYKKYGPPEVLQLKEVEKPVPDNNQILIKIHATTCHIGDVRVRSLDIPFPYYIPFRFYLGFFKPKNSVLGMELAGEVESVGKDVKRFKAGDKVFATTGFKFGAYAEYICMAEHSDKIKNGLVTFMPNNMTYEEAAAGITTGGMTALALIKKVKLDKSTTSTGKKKVMIYGASGSLGSYAVQLAKYFGAEVTGVCSTGNIEMVSSLGADNVIDYTKEDLSKYGKNYDMVYDAVYKLSSCKGKKLLAAKGIYLRAGAGESVNIEDLNFLKDLAEEGKLKAIIDRKYPLEEIVEAHRYVGKGHKKGHVVITV